MSTLDVHADGAHEPPEDYIASITEPRSAMVGYTLPEIDFVASPNLWVSRWTPIRAVCVHRWGGGSFDGVVNEFRSAASEVSAHVVYAGEAVRDRGKCAQMVPVRSTAWTCKAYNRLTINVECGDAMWAGLDMHGFNRAARAVAFLCHAYGLPPRWTTNPVVRTGVVRHYDLGIRGGGHTDPTTSTAVWQAFMRRVAFEYERGGFRPHWTQW